MSSLSSKTNSATISLAKGIYLEVADRRGRRSQREYLSPVSNMHAHELQVNSFKNCSWTLLLYLNDINSILVKSQDPHLGVYFTWVASRIKSWMIICSSLERHSLSLLIRVTVKASQFMDSSRLGQYTNSSSAWRNEQHTTAAFEIPCVWQKNPVDQKIGLINRDDQELTFKNHSCLKQIYYYSRH